MTVFRPLKAGVPGDNMIDVSIDYSTSGEPIWGAGVHANTGDFIGSGLLIYTEFLHQTQRCIGDKEAACYIQIHREFEHTCWAGKAVNPSKDLFW